MADRLIAVPPFPSPAPRYDRENEAQFRRMLHQEFERALRREFSRNPGPITPPPSAGSVPVGWEHRAWPGVVQSSDISDGAASADLTYLRGDGNFRTKLNVTSDGSGGGMSGETRHVYDEDLRATCWRLTLVDPGGANRRGSRVKQTQFNGVPPMISALLGNGDLSRMGTYYVATDMSISGLANTRFTGGVWLSGMMNPFNFSEWGVCGLLYRPKQSPNWLLAWVLAPYTGDVEQTVFSEDTGIPFSDGEIRHLRVELSQTDGQPVVSGYIDGVLVAQHVGVVDKTGLGATYVADLTAGITRSLGFPPGFGFISYADQLTLPCTIVMKAGMTSGFVYGWQSPEADWS